MTTPSVPARRPTAGAVRGPVRACLTARISPAACLLASRLLLLDPEQLFRLRPEAAQLSILRLVLLHPPDGLVEPLAGLFLLAQLLVGHRQKEPIRGIAAASQRH